MPQTTEYSDFEFRADADSTNLSGYAASYLTVDSHGSTFGRSAFKKTIRENGNRIPVLHNHDPNKLIGKVDSFRSDQKGLFFNARIVEETQMGKDVMALVRAGALEGMSFGFNSIKERTGTPQDGIDLTGLRGVKPEDIRFIEEVRMKEISTAPFPSNLHAGITKYRTEEDRFAFIIEELREMGVEDDRVEALIASLREVREEGTGDTDEPSSDTQVVDESRREDDDALIDLALSGVYL